MPEGPEVRRCADQLRGLILGKYVTPPVAISGKLARKGIPGRSTLIPAIPYHQLTTQVDNGLVKDLQFPFLVEDVRVRGKAIFIKMHPTEMHTHDDSYPSESLYIISTLGMSGWWYPNADHVDPAMVAHYNGKTIRALDVVTQALKHVRAVILTHPGPIANGVIANFVDPRNFGNLSIVDERGYGKFISKLGPDLLNDPVTLDVWKDALLRKRNLERKIGEILLDQSVLCGLGNIYRAETLYLARVSPHQRVGKLSDDEHIRLLDAARLVLDTAYYNHGNMKYEIETAQGSTMIDGFAVYGRRKDHFGNFVGQSKLGGRTLWWAPAVQRDPHDEFVSYASTSTTFSLGATAGTVTIRVPSLGATAGTVTIRVPTTMTTTFLMTGFPVDDKESTT